MGSLQKEKISEPFTATAIYSSEDQQAFAYFRDHEKDIDVITGRDLIISFPEEPGGTTHPLKGLWDDEGLARYPGLKRRDLPCLWMDGRDNKEEPYIIHLSGMTEGDLTLVIRDLTDAATDADSLAALKKDFEKRQAARRASPPATALDKAVNQGDKEAPIVSPEKPVPPSGALGLLRAGIEAVPAVKYAAGVAGVMAAVSLGTAFFSSPAYAFLGTVAMLFLMVILFLFAIATRMAAAVWQTPALVFTWAVLVLVVGSAMLLMTSVFFRYPMPYVELVGQFRSSPPSSTPNSTPPAVSPTIRFTIVVQKRGFAKGIVGARVGIEGAQPPVTATTDGQGAAQLELPQDKTENLRLLVQAEGFENGTLNITHALKDASYTVSLALKQTPHTNVPSLQGSWEVHVDVDINNARIQNGTFAFSQQQDGTYIANANFHADDMEVTLSGTATSQASRVFLRFDAKTNEGGAWSGRGTFTFTGKNRLTGRIRSKRGDDIPVSLRKL